MMAVTLPAAPAKISFSIFNHIADFYLYVKNVAGHGRGNACSACRNGGGGSRGGCGSGCLNGSCGSRAGGYFFDFDFIGSAVYIYVKLTHCFDFLRQ